MLTLVKKNLCTRDDCGGQYYLTDYLPVETTRWMGPVTHLVDALTKGEGFLRHVLTCVSRPCKPCQILDRELLKRDIDPLDFRLTLPVECLLCGWVPGGKEAAAKRLALYEKLNRGALYCRLGKHLRTEFTIYRVPGDESERCTLCRDEREGRDRADFLSDEWDVLVASNSQSITLVTG